jgi:hypothetical protein
MQRKLPWPHLLGNLGALALDFASNREEQAQAIELYHQLLFRLGNAKLQSYRERWQRDRRRKFGCAQTKLE